MLHITAIVEDVCLSATRDADSTGMWTVRLTDGVTGIAAFTAWDDRVIASVLALSIGGEDAPPEVVDHHYATCGDVFDNLPKELRIIP